MDVARLRTLLVTVDAGSFTAAATRLGISQPAVSAQIRRLEDDAGHVLIERSAHPLRLTPVGRQLLPSIHRAVDAHDSLLAEAAAIDGLAAGSVRIGAMTGAPTGELAEVIAEFVGRHPGVDVSLLSAASEQLADDLLIGELDLAMVVEPSPSLEWIDLGTHALVAAVPLDHPWSDLTTVDLATVRSARLIGMAAGTGVRAICDRATDAGFRFTYEASTPAGAAEFCALGLGVAILPKPVADADERLVALPIDGVDLAGRVAIAWVRGRPLSPAAAALCDRLRALAAA